MELSIFQAAILAAYYWFAATRIVYSLIHILRGPLMTSLFCGIVLGDVPTAIMIGAMIQPMFLAFTAAGGTIVWDEAAATIVGCTVTILSGIELSQAVTIAVPVAFVCTAAYHPPYRHGISGTEGG